VICFEMTPGVIDKLPVAGTVHGFHGDDLLDESRLVLADVFDEFGLFVGRASDKHRSCIRDTVGNSLQEIMIFRRVSASDALK